MVDVRSPYMHWISVRQARVSNEFNEKRAGFVLVVLLANILYAIAYTEVYMRMAVFWGYLGYGAFGYEHNWQLVGGVIVAIAGLFVPLSRRDIGNFLVCFVFYIVYIPCIMTPFIQGFVDFETCVANGVLLAGSFIVLSLSIRATQSDETTPPQILVPGFFWLGLLGVWALGNLFVLYTYGSSLRFASFAEVYDQRFESDLVAGSALVGYVVGNMSCAINPVLLALGLQRKSFALSLMAVASQAVMYSTSALRAIIVATLMIVAFHFLFSNRDGPKIRLFFFGLLGVTVTGMVLGPFYTAGRGTLDQIFSLVYMRTLTTPGMIYGTYLDFFSRYPVTYLSHVNIVRTIIPYPYGELQIGQVVGNFITPAVSIESLNINASYLATDGIAAFGLAGIVVVTLISGILFTVIARLLRNTDPQLVTVTMVAFLTYLSNVSFFTALLSYGGLLTIGLLWLVPRAGVRLDRGPGWHII